MRVHFITESHTMAWVYHSSFMHLPMKDIWLLPSFDNYKAAVNICIQVFVLTYLFTSVGQISKEMIARLGGETIFSFVRNCQTVFHSGCTILTFPPEMNESPHLHQKLLWPVKQFFSILAYVYHCFNCIMAHDIEVLFAICPCSSVRCPDSWLIF